MEAPRGTYELLEFCFQVDDDTQDARVEVVVYCSLTIDQNLSPVLLAK